MHEIENESVVVGGKYRLAKKIGGGAFGDVFLGTHTC